MHDLVMLAVIEDVLNLLTKARGIWRRIGFYFPWHEPVFERKYTEIDYGFNAKRWISPL